MLSRAHLLYEHLAKCSAFSSIVVCIILNTSQIRTIIPKYERFDRRKVTPVKSIYRLNVVVKQESLIKT